MMINWQNGTWYSDYKKTNMSDYRITVASDWMPRSGSNYEKIALSNPKQIYGNLLEEFHKSDLNIVNVEGVLGNCNTPIIKAGPNIKANPGVVNSLIEAKFHIACLANNHIMDFGLDGLENTIKILEYSGINTTGAGENKQNIEEPLISIIPNSKNKLAIINCAEGESGRSINDSPGVYGLDVYKIHKQITKIKENNLAEVIIVIFHGGRQYAPVPPPYVVHKLRQVADAGADVIIGHHPHVPQGIEIYDNRIPIIYSLGNFVFYQAYEQIYRHLGYLLHLDFHGSKLNKLSLTPYFIGAEGLTKLNDEKRFWLFDKLQKASSILIKQEYVYASWLAFAEQLGHESLVNDIKKSIDKLPGEIPNKINDKNSLNGLANLQNLFFTPAHSQLYSELLRNIITSKNGNYPKWIKDLNYQWLNLNYNKEFTN